jgi:molecular chaperone GrpE
MSKQQKIAEYSKAAEAGEEEQTGKPTVTDSNKDVESGEASEPDAKDPNEQLQEELTLARDEAKETYDRLLRVMAEYENYKKRSTRDMQDLRKYANEAILKDLLHIIDNLERAVASTPGDASDASQLLEGVDLTLKEMCKIIEKHGVQAIDALDQPFDPNYHEAMMQEQTDLHPDNTVIKQLQKGYSYHERLLRPAMVVVSKRLTPAKDIEKQSETADDTSEVIKNDEKQACSSEK